MEQPLTAVYDANILYPAPIRDLFIRLAQAGLVRARWTEQIHDEWMRNVLADNPQLVRFTNVDQILVKTDSATVSTVINRDLIDSESGWVDQLAVQSRAERVCCSPLWDRRRGD